MLLQIPIPGRAREQPGMHRYRFQRLGRVGWQSESLGVGSRGTLGGALLLQIPIPGRAREQPGRHRYRFQRLGRVGSLQILFPAA